MAYTVKCDGNIYRKFGFIGFTFSSNNDIWLQNPETKEIEFWFHLTTNHEKVSINWCLLTIYLQLFLRVRREIF